MNSVESRSTSEKKPFEATRIWKDGNGPSRERIVICVESRDYETPGDGTSDESQQSHAHDQLRVWRLLGARPGPRILLCAGVHGDEYEGIRALQEFAQSLDVDSLSGTLAIVPVVNEGAVAAGSRCHPDDEKDLARTFPGNPKGTISERIAYAFVQELLRGCDLLVDIHSSGVDSRIRPWAGYQLRTERVQEVQTKAAIAFGLDVVWGTIALPGRTLSAAGELGVPAIYVEMPGEGRVRRSDIETVKTGVTQVLASMDALPGAFPKDKPRWFVESESVSSSELQKNHIAPQSGLFFPMVDLWDYVNFGDTLGNIYGPWGDIAFTVRAEDTGRVIRLRTFPTVHVGDSLASILPTDD